MPEQSLPVGRVRQSSRRFSGGLKAPGSGYWGNCQRSSPRELRTGEANRGEGIADPSVGSSRNSGRGKPGDRNIQPARRAQSARMNNQQYRYARQQAASLARRPFCWHARRTSSVATARSDLYPGSAPDSRTFGGCHDDLPKETNGEMEIGGSARCPDGDASLPVAPGFRPSTWISIARFQWVASAALAAPKAGWLGSPAWRFASVAAPRKPSPAE